MSSILDLAIQFQEACDGGKGWEGCKEFCGPDATFSAQTTALAEISTLEGYCEWAKNILTPIPNGHCEVKFFAADQARNSAAVFAVFIGTQTGEGGPVPPTGKSVSAEYVYHMEFDGDRIKHMTKIWNDMISLQQLGWA